MAETSEEFQKDVGQLQNLQRQLQVITAQRQRLELEVVQIDTALAELEKADGKVYKSIGTLLIEDKPADLKKELNTRRQDVNDRVETLKKQEKNFQTKGESLQKKIQKELEKPQAS